MLQAMDDAIRRAERGGDWRDQAALLRRAGRSVEARRLLEDQARGGDSDALALLEEWFPLDEETREALWILGEDLEDCPWERRWRHDQVALMLVGDTDPRLDGALIHYATANRRGRHDQAVWETLPSLLEQACWERLIGSEPRRSPGPTRRPARPLRCSIT